MHSWHKCESAATNSVLSIPRCNLLFRHWRTVQVYNRPKLGDVRLKPSWEQRISWWSSTIKRLPYVNRANPLWKRRVMPVWFHAQSTHWKWFSGHVWTVMGGKSFVKSQPPTQSHCSCKMFCHTGFILVSHWTLALCLLMVITDFSFYCSIVLNISTVQHTAIYR